MASRPADFLISADTLKRRIGEPGVRIVDGSWYLPTHNRDAKAEFEAGHIPGAVFFDIDAISDQDSDLPHMLPSAEAFAAAAGAVGLSERDDIVVYDGIGFFSAPRVWWTLRTFGAERVRVLDGGLPAWVAAAGALETGPDRPRPTTFRAQFDPASVRDRHEVAKLLASGDATVVDARSAARFAGEVPEPRPGMRAGHMPGALNLPYDRLAGADGRMLSPEAIRAEFDAAGVPLDRPVVTSCGSGVTAAVLTLALNVAGEHDVAIYDGSWSEWGSRTDTPVAKGGP